MAHSAGLRERSSAAASPAFSAEVNDSSLARSSSSVLQEPSSGGAPGSPRGERTASVGDAVGVAAARATGVATGVRAVGAQARTRTDASRTRITLQYKRLGSGVPVSVARHTLACQGCPKTARATPIGPRLGTVAGG